MVPPQFQLLTEQKGNILKAIAQLIDQDGDRECFIFVPISGHDPLRVAITLQAGHWIMVGSALIRLENLPISYEGNDFDADILISLLNLDEVDRSTISAEDVHITHVSGYLSDSHTIDLWIKEQTTIAWNGQ